MILSYVQLAYYSTGHRDLRTSDGDTCRASNGTWTPPIGCVDSIFVVPGINTAERTPRVLADIIPIWTVSDGHTSAWGGKVESARVLTVEGDSSRHHGGTVLYNGRGDEMAIERIIELGARWYVTTCGVFITKD